MSGPSLLKSCIAYLTRSIPWLIAMCIAAVAVAWQIFNAIAGALAKHEMNALWALAIMFAGLAIIATVWRIIWAYRRVVEHKRWVGGLGEGLAARLDAMRGDKR